MDAESREKGCWSHGGHGYCSKRLNLRELGPLASHMRWFIWLMAAGGTIYVFLYHEKYKVVELFFYLTMGFSPALVVTSMCCL
ncbi:monocyte to macrophage differentiation factor-like [Vicugna pacos]|uniref:Monocyte to macrophage differentiation factor-like n=1 Tax=Vicugna pacos TaxID=30538 RepID=A0ABM5BE67_VICPA